MSLETDSKGQICKGVSKAPTNTSGHLTGVERKDPEIPK